MPGDSSSVHKTHLQEKPGGPSGLFLCRQSVFCSEPFYLFLIAKGEQELSKDLAQVPGRESGCCLLWVAGGDTALRRRGEGWKGRAKQTLPPPFFPFQGEFTYFSTPTSFFPQFPNASCSLPALPHTHTTTPFPKHPPWMPHDHKLL